MSADDFRVAVQRLLTQVGHWENPRWAATASSGAGPRGELVHGLVQRLADLGADAEHRPHREVPRQPDMVLPDQLRVMADDLLTAEAGDDLLTAAAKEVLAVREAL